MHDTLSKQCWASSQSQYTREVHTHKDAQFDPYSTKSWGLVANSCWCCSLHPTPINIQGGSTHACSLHCCTALGTASTHQCTHGSIQVPCCTSLSRPCPTRHMPQQLKLRSWLQCLKQTSLPLLVRSSSTPPSCLAPECMLVSPEPATCLVKTATGLPTATNGPEKEMQVMLSTPYNQGLLIPHRLSLHNFKLVIRLQGAANAAAGTVVSSSSCITAALATCWLHICSIFI